MAKAHVSLNVSNLEASVAFYRGFLGAEPVKLKADYAKFDLQDPPLNLTMNLRAPSEAGEAPRVSHLGIQVGGHEAVEAARQRLEAANMLDLDEADTVCCYARQDKVWATDPDGNAWEVFFVVEADVEASSFQSQSCSPTLCGPEAEAVEADASQGAAASCCA